MAKQGVMPWSLEPMKITPVLRDEGIDGVKGFSSLFGNLDECLENKDTVMYVDNLPPHKVDSGAALPAPLSFFEKAGPPELSCYVPMLVRFAERGDHAGTRQLLDEGHDPDSKDDFGLTALHCAAKKGHRDTVALLLERGANCNVVERGGKTPLHFASKYGRAGVAEVLLQYGADPRAIALDGCAALSYAQAKSHTAVESILLAALRSGGAS